MGRANLSEQEHFEDFFEEFLEELGKIAEVEEMVVCKNAGDHMFGNTYVRFASEKDAETAKKHFEGRYYAGRQINCLYTAVTDFREGRCRQFDERTCNRGDFCNFLHLMPVPKFARQLFASSRYHKKRRDRGDTSDNEAENDTASKNKHKLQVKYRRKFPIRGTSRDR